MMEFKRYGAIENSYRDVFVDDIRRHGLADPKVRWCVTEKVNGANFSFWCDGKEVKCAKRSCFISKDGEGFFGSKILYEKHKQSVMLFHKYLATNNLIPHRSTIALYGVCYNDDVEFILFDIHTKYGFDDVGTVAYYAEFVLKMTVEPFLMSGTFDECFNHSNEFKSKVRAKLKLPELECSNTCNGVIIKPVEPKYLDCGSRAILKNKNDTFKA